ncbi:MAG: tryptophan-rich sensory protein [Flavobacterium sp.]|nr:tryptophan-rich sensory protein [Pedobacter sp.]
MKPILQISNFIALILTLVINYLSNTGIFNGNTMATISAENQNLFTPAGYAFSIWGIIYIFLFSFVIYQGLSLFYKSFDDKVVLQIGWWFVVTCLANSAWVLAWLYNYIGISVLIMLLLLFSLLQIVIKTEMELTMIPLKKIVFTWWPFSIYFGWISVAAIANISAYLTKIEWDGFGISEINWAIIMIFIAGIINLFMIWKRNMREFALVGIWALLAVAVANYNSVQPVVIAAIFVSLVLLLNVLIHAFKNRNQFL